MKTMKIKMTSILPRCERNPEKRSRVASSKPAHLVSGWESSIYDDFNADLDEQEVEAEESEDEMRNRVDQITPSNDTLLKMAERNPPSQSWHSESPQEPPEN
jgi:hypothetical protein